MNIYARETRYAGHRFRSRLEARWAVFFDTLKIPYQYEPEGFRWANMEHGTMSWLPDFHLPRSHTWVEVKGDWMQFLAEHPKWFDAHDYGCSPLPNFTESFGSMTGILLLGEIPRYTPHLVLHPLITHTRGLYVQQATFLCGEGGHLPSGPEHLNPDIYHQFCGNESLLPFLPYTVNEGLNCYSAVSLAYTAARSARFEHGETPMVRP